jgi:hypothetical protein
MCRFYSGLCEASFILYIVLKFRMVIVESVYEQSINKSINVLYAQHYLQRWLLVLLRAAASPRLEQQQR